MTLIIGGAEFQRGGLAAPVIVPPGPARYLLDTGVVGEAAKPRPSEALAAWLEGQDDGNLFVAALTIAELRRAMLDMPSGGKRRDLEEWFIGPDGPRALFAGRILPFDVNASLVWAQLMAEGKARGRPRGALDMMIAAVASANDCTVVTLDERAFAGIEVLNPARVEA